MAREARHQVKMDRNEMPRDNDFSRRLRALQFEKSDVSPQDVLSTSQSDELGIQSFGQVGWLDAFDGQLPRKWMRDTGAIFS
jgi:hypothetical protein